MMTLRDVTIRFGDNTLFSNLNHRFSAGTITAVRKHDVLDGGSTLLKCCAGIVKPAAGAVLLGEDELDVDDMAPAQRFRAACYCHESGGLVSLFTIYNNLALPLLYHSLLSEAEIAQRIHAVAERLEIAHLLDAEPFQLNDVQQRLVNLARAMIIQSPVVLVDEIQTGMSTAMLTEIVHILLEMASTGSCILMVTTAGHDDSFAHHHLVIRNHNLECLS